MQSKITVYWYLLKRFIRALNVPCRYLKFSIPRDKSLRQTRPNRLKLSLKHPWVSAFGKYCLVCCFTIMGLTTDISRDISKIFRTNRTQLNDSFRKEGRTCHYLSDVNFNIFYPKLLLAVQQFKWRQNMEQRADYKKFHYTLHTLANSYCKSLMALFFESSTS